VCVSVSLCLSLSLSLSLFLYVCVCVCVFLCCVRERDDREGEIATGVCMRESVCLVCERESLYVCLCRSLSFSLSVCVCVCVCFVLCERRVDREREIATGGCVCVDGCV